MIIRTTENYLALVRTIVLGLREPIDYIKKNQITAFELKIVTFFTYNLATSSLFYSLRKLKNEGHLLRTTEAFNITSPIICSCRKI